MITRYFETRRRVHYLPANMVADVMRHLQARQHLGKAVVVCEDPSELLAIAHKQWLKLARTLQRRRAFTTNAVEILKYTYTITQMQQMTFVAKPPQDLPEANAFFVRPDQARVMPANCFSVYLTTDVPDEGLSRLVAELPSSSLVVDYTGRISRGDFGLKLKAELEAQVATSWQAVEMFLEREQIDISRLDNSTAGSEAMDDALDILLGVDAEFLAVASMFQRSLDLARPLRNIAKTQRDSYEAFVLLAHRVQTFAPSGFSAQFLRTYADDTFFLNDGEHPHESLAEAVARHRAAGRLNVARALMGLGGFAAPMGAGIGAPMNARLYTLV